MRKRVLSILLMLTLAFTMIPSCGTNVYATSNEVSVNSTETLQTALDSAKDGDTIVLAAGTYGTVYLRNKSEAENRIMRNVTIKAASGATVNIQQIASAVSLNKYLDIENLVIDDLTFYDPAKTGVWFDYNWAGEYGMLRVNGLTIKNCTKVGDKRTSGEGGYENCTFVGFYFDAATAPTKYAGDTNLDCGYHNITIKDNIITKVNWPITFPNEGPKSSLVVTGNTFDDCYNNHIQVSGSSIGGTNVISDNTIKNLSGRFARISGATADATFTIENNSVVTPKVFDIGDSGNGSDGDGTIIKISGTAGFTVTEVNNEWADGKYTDNNKLTWTSMGDIVAKIGDAKYSSVADAIAAVKDGETIQLLGASLTEKLPVIENSKSFTIKGIESLTSIGVAEGLGNMQGNVTFENLVFTDMFRRKSEGGSVTFKKCKFTGEQGVYYCYSYAKNNVNAKWTFTDCEFKPTDKYALHFDDGRGVSLECTNCTFNGKVNGMRAGYSNIATFTNCSFDGGTADGNGKYIAEIKLRANSTFTNCTFTKKFADGIQADYNQDDNGINVVDGLIYSFYSCSISGSEDSVSTLVHLEGTAKAYYYDYVATIASNKYYTLADAIAAVPKNNTKTTIKMIADETVIDNGTMTIAKDQNIVLDLNGKTVSGKNFKTSSWALLTNLGTLEVTDTSTAKNGKITSCTQPETDGYSGYYTVLNKNIMTLTAGCIEETSDKVGGGNNLKWALRNEASVGQTVSLTINGGRVIAEYNAISNYVYDNTSTCNMTVNDGYIASTGRFSPVTVQIAGATAPKANINITGGEFVTLNTRNTNANGNATIYCDDQSSKVTDISGLKFNITGGKFYTYNTSMVVQFDDFKAEQAKPTGYIKNVYCTNVIPSCEITSAYCCVTLSGISTDEGYDNNYYALSTAGYKYKIVFCTSKQVDTKAIVNYENGNGEASRQTEYHNNMDAAVESAKDGMDDENTAKITITVEEGAIVADIDDSVKVIAKTGENNNVGAAPGYELNNPVEDAVKGTTTYTADPLAIGYADKEKTESTKGSGTIEVKMEAVKSVEAEAEVEASASVSTIASTVMEVPTTSDSIVDAAQVVANNINQGIAARALNDDTSLTVRNTKVDAEDILAKNVSVFIEVYYQTKVTEDKTAEAEKSFTLDITPMYKAYATKLSVTGATTSENFDVGNDSAVITETKELDMSGKNVTMKLKLPNGFVSSTSDKVYVTHIKDNGSKSYYDATVEKDGNDYYAVFVNPDGFSQFTFSLKDPNQSETSDDNKTVFTASVPTYDINVASIKGGTIRVSNSNAAEGTTVIITVTSDTGYDLETITVKSASGKEIDVYTMSTGEKFSFVMPKEVVNITATYMENNEMLNFFFDVTADDYYYDSVLWAAKNNITDGVDETHFGPSFDTTRAQMVTFLWRAAGCPVVNYAMPFTDVDQDAYYAEAVRWGASMGYVLGTSDTTFSPDAKVTRGQALTFLWRYNGSIAFANMTASGPAASPYTDVATNAYYYNAVLWAAGQKVTQGTSDITFSPNNNCTRAEVVTFLYRSVK